MDGDMLGSALEDEPADGYRHGNFGAQELPSPPDFTTSLVGHSLPGPSFRSVIPRPIKVADHMLRLVLREVEVQKLHRLDIASQSFQAQIWMEFLIPGGALDPSLSAGHASFPPTQHFPLDENGRPTFTPSATWYMAQIDCRNALSWRVVDGKVMSRGDDLVMAVRVEGTFVEVYELTDYPFDVQGLTMTLNFNCRAHGPMPIDIRVEPSCSVTMTCINLCPPIREYSLEPQLYIRAHLVGTGERTFPGISFSAKVARHPFYHIVFAAVPMGLFSLLALLTGAGRQIDSLGHRAHLNMILVLTAAAYRIASSRGLPPINCTRAPRSLVHSSSRHRCDAYLHL